MDYQKPVGELLFCAVGENIDRDGFDTFIIASYLSVLDQHGIRHASKAVELVRLKLSVISERRERDRVDPLNGFIPSGFVYDI